MKSRIARPTPEPHRFSRVSTRKVVYFGAINAQFRRSHFYVTALTISAAFA
jgi:hypothetical protein